jgi:hypothetical protein
MPNTTALIFMTKDSASELNDKLIEGIYYTPEGEYLGEKYNARD